MNSKYSVIGFIYGITGSENILDKMHNFRSAFLVALRIQIDTPRRPVYVKCMNYNY